MSSVTTKVERFGATLAKLALPPLAKKSFLALGGYADYLCGYAHFDGAKNIVGLISTAGAMSLARTRFPQCEFRKYSRSEPDLWLQAEEKFDVIVCSSLLHMVSDASQVLAALMSHLQPDGLLVLQMAISHPDRGAASESEYDRKGFYPTWQETRQLLSQYAHRHKPANDDSDHDFLTQEVIHVRHRRPYAILLMGEPTSGKSTLANGVFQHLPVIHGDELMHQHAEELTLALNEPFDVHNIASTIKKLFAAGAVAEYVQLILAYAGKDSFVYEGFVPTEHRLAFVNEFIKKHYLPVQVNLPSPVRQLEPLARRGRQEARKFQMFLAASRRNRR